MNKQLSIQSISGYCPEEAVWKMLTDISAIMKGQTCGETLSQNTIYVDGNTFFAVSLNSPLAFVYSSKELVWQLASSAYYMATGHEIFGGFGAQYQQDNPSVPLPVLPKGQEKLTSVLHKCLCYDSAKRISFEELNKLSTEGLKTCRAHKRQNAEPYVNRSEETKTKAIVDKWPETMTEV